MPAVPTDTGADIRRAYEDAGLSRQAFAALADVPPKTITNVTSGGHCSRSTAARIAHALNQARARLGLVRDWTPDRVLGKRPEPSRPRDNRPPKDTPKPPPDAPARKQPKKQVAA
ncbi:MULTISPECIES: helix-turn-helix domain-containing protein [Prauserella salsuginis group]|uniref:DNA-binding XRE family transcriptional regulator n=2 Tax=Prauserella salsuginis group TaxID=2893672 RepID=A0A839Y392_9PSEU|nr:MULTISPECIES: helix-turn-helix transcriptional regulator [Prauserella salsuginis group]MBB3666385.1 DNA-binding XRE family transcriptional regulator [Prauserella sediminis]MCR3719174.1 Helix-turn-helix domain [Prauserella flava]MCR3735813.1 Helix-turn-helix domain [Prauserella salsuginis]